MKMQGGDLFERITSMDNLREAHRKARKGKAHYREVQWVNKNEEAALGELRRQLLEGRFRTSEYVVEHTVKGGKDRTIHKLPYYPDRIVQHALVNVCGPAWIRSLIRDTFQSLPGRGTTDCFRRVRRAAQRDKPRYAIKLDISKFYPSVKNQHLLDPRVFRIKCPRTFAVLEDIICSLDGLPLGNHTSQYGGNLVLSPIDWYAKQTLGLRHYFRYCDDIVILADSRVQLLTARHLIQQKLAAIDLELKPDCHIIDLKSQMLDFVGYRFSHDRVLLRKSLAQNFKRACKAKNTASVPSYYGWCKHANAINLFQRHATRATRP